MVTDLKHQSVLKWLQDSVKDTVGRVPGGLVEDVKYNFTRQEVSPLRSGVVTLPVPAVVHRYTLV